MLHLLEARRDVLLHFHYASTRTREGASLGAGAALVIMAKLLHLITGRELKPGTAITGEINLR